ncbi:MAG: low temperature requirement protein A [Actinomycetota bacterium]
MGTDALKKMEGWIPRPDAEEDLVANPVELFFDLAFVIAFAQLASHVAHHPDVGSLDGVWLLAIIIVTLFVESRRLDHPEDTARSEGDAEVAAEAIDPPS